MSATNDLANLIADIKEQILYLQELGVEAVDVKLTDTAESGKWKVESKVSIGEPNDSAKEAISNFRSEISKPPESRFAGQSRLASLPSLSNRNSRPHRDSSVPFRNTATGGTSGTPGIEERTETLFDIVPSLPEPTETIPQIRAEIGPDCTRCKLATLGRKQVVNSTGNFNADLMFVGEAPGADEDEQGFPFVGRAGRLLTDIMMAIGYSREDVFIGNINRCRPPGNRAPEQDETIACKPFLKREIAVVRPKVIVVLGATAAHNLLETKVPIGKLRGNFHDYHGTKVMPTFHPAYLLRDPHKKREVWEDMKMVRDYLTSVKT